MILGFIQVLPGEIVGVCWSQDWDATCSTGTRRVTTIFMFFGFSLELCFYKPRMNTNGHKAERRRSCPRITLINADGRVKNAEPDIRVISGSRFLTSCSLVLIRGFLSKVRSCVI